MTIITNYKFGTIVTSDHSIEHLKPISLLFKDYISCSKNLENIIISGCKLIAQHCQIFPGKMKVSFQSCSSKVPYFPIISPVVSSIENGVKTYKYECGYTDFNAIPESVKLALIEIIKQQFIINSNNLNKKIDLSFLRKLCPIMI